MYKLIIEDDEGKTTVVPLIRDEITIGRKEGNTIRLTERNVSRRHAKLVKSNGSVFIEDLTSYNGIKVNGDRIAGRAPVNEGDRVQIGDYQLALKLDKAATAASGSHAAPVSGVAPTMPSAVPAAEMTEQKTTPFIKENGAAPAAMLDMAPTVQTPILPTTVTTAPVSGQQEAPARLVVVSSNFAGQEFVLDKAAVVIGRTDENDVVINHRTITSSICRAPTAYASTARNTARSSCARATTSTSATCGCASSRPAKTSSSIATRRWSTSRARGSRGPGWSPCSCSSSSRSPAARSCWSS
jgi:pSer/pThr/pTyr-binding forkhead associated (FHA) protein